MKILIIDDNEHARMIYRKAFEHNEIEVLDTDSAENAIGLLDSTIDAILLDIALPGMSGIDFLKKIREYNKKVKVIILSAWATADYVSEALENGAVYYLKKPFDVKELTKIVNEFNQNIA